MSAGYIPPRRWRNGGKSVKTKNKNLKNEILNRSRIVVRDMVQDDRRKDEIATTIKRSREDRIRMPSLRIFSNLAMIMLLGLKSSVKKYCR
jgi:hypothetical protein